jgi:AcrR family transcriptional regulator
MYASRGYTFSAIAATLGVSRATVYRHPGATAALPTSARRGKVT